MSNETHLAPFSLTQTAGETIPETLIKLGLLSMKIDFIASLTNSCKKVSGWQHIHTESDG